MLVVLGTESSGQWPERGSGGGVEKGEAGDKAIEVRGAYQEVIKRVEVGE